MKIDFEYIGKNKWKLKKHDKDFFITGFTLLLSEGAEFRTDDIRYLKLTYFSCFLSTTSRIIKTEVEGVHNVVFFDMDELQLPVFDKINDITIEMVLKHEAKKPKFEEIGFVVESRDEFEPFPDEYDINVCNDVYEKATFNVEPEYACFINNSKAIKKPTPDYMLPESISYVVISHDSPVYVGASLDHAKDLADFLSLENAPNSSAGLDKYKVYRCQHNAQDAGTYTLVYTPKWTNLLKKESLEHMWWLNEKYHEELRRLMR